MTPADPWGTGRAVDAAVCERVLGWKHTPNLRAIVRSWPDVPGWVRPDNEAELYPARVSTDPTQFFALVVPAMRAKGWTWSANTERDAGVDFAWERADGSWGCQHVNASTITEAGCRAALNALAARTPDPGVGEGE